MSLEREAARAIANGPHPEFTRIAKALAPEYAALRHHLFYGGPLCDDEPPGREDPFYTPGDLSREDVETEAVLNGLDTLIAELERVRNDVRAGCGVQFVRRTLGDRPNLVIADHLSDLFREWTP